MSVDKATVQHVARLARIKITDEEAGKLESEISTILAWVEQLDEVDTSNVEPMTSVVDFDMKKRDDEVTDGSKPDDIVSNAPEVDGHYFVVPRVVE